MEKFRVSCEKYNEGIKIKNIGAISNPDVLNEYKNIPDLKELMIKKISKV